MDYKELIKKLRARKIKTDFGKIKLDICGKAADAIETLLEEREAAVGGLIGDCSVCKHWNKFERVATGKCTLCKYSKKMLVPISNIIRDDDNWEWVGPTPPDRQQTED